MALFYSLPPSIIIFISLYLLSLQARAYITHSAFSILAALKIVSHIIKTTGADSALPMFSVRRISGFPAYVVQSAIRDAWPYQLLAQDASVSTNAGRKMSLRLGLRSRSWKLFACIIAFLCVPAAFVYSRGDGILSTINSLGLSRTDI